jgi:hypothetical protein
MVTMNDNALSRTPFRVRDELMIVSMARWMRFIGVIKVVGGLMTVFVLLVAISSRSPPRTRSSRYRFGWPC